MVARNERKDKGQRYEDRNYDYDECVHICMYVHVYVCVCIIYWVHYFLS